MLIYRIYRSIMTSSWFYLHHIRIESDGMHMAGRVRIRHCIPWMCVQLCESNASPPKDFTDCWLFYAFFPSLFFLCDRGHRVYLALLLTVPLFESEHFHWIQNCLFFCYVTTWLLLRLEHTKGNKAELILICFANFLCKNVFFSLGK